MRSSRGFSSYHWRATRAERSRKRKKPAIRRLLRFRARCLAALSSATLLGATTLLGAATLLGATLPTAALLCSHGNLSIMECSALDRSPGGSARRRRGAEALRSPQHTSPRRRVKPGDSYIRQLALTMLRILDACRSIGSIVGGE